MPKKRPLTANAVTRLQRRARDARTRLVLFRIAASGHFRQSHEIRQQTERLLKQFDQRWHRSGPRIAASSSTNAVSFSSARTT
jgi:hypothetical protein